MAAPPSDPGEPEHGSGSPPTSLTMADVLALPDEERALVTWMLRQGEVNLEAVAAHLVVAAEDALSRLLALESKGFVREIMEGGDERFRTQIAGRKPAGRSDLWRALGDKLPD